MSPPEEELGAPRRLLGRRTAVALGAVVVLLLGAGIVVRLSGHEHRPGPAAAPNRSGHPEIVRPTMPVAAATDALVPWLSTRETLTSSGTIARSAQLINEAAVPLTVDGPIQILGPDRQPVPHVSAKLVAGARWTALPELQAGPALRTVGAHQRVVLIVTGTLDCDTESTQSTWPARYPTIVIPIAGFAAPWSKSFQFLFSERWLAGVEGLDSCGPAATG